MPDDLKFSPPKPSASAKPSTETAPAVVQKEMERKKRLALSKVMLEQSTILISNIYQLIKTAQIHDLNNVAFQSPLDNFCQAINSLPGEDEFRLSYVDENVFLNETRLRMDISNFLSIRNLGKELNLRSVGGVSFFKSMTTEELKKFIQAFVSLDQKLDSPIDMLREQMDKLQIKHIAVENIRKMDEFDQGQATKEERTKFAMKTYFHAISSYKAIMKNVRNERLGTDARKAKKIVQTLVDICAEEGTSILGLATIKDFDEYTYNHSVNVCILSIAFGQKLGLSKKQLCDLGSAALFHDIGKTDIPIEVLNKSGKFSDGEWAMMQSHPVLGVKELLRMKGFSETTVYRILVAHQHHIGLDGSGYPDRKNPKPLHFYTKLVSICDTFDAMTTTRVYQKAMRPDEALRLMSKTVAKRYDPLLLKAFVNTLGVFPVGTLVQLNTREIAVVVECQEDAALMRQPRVKIAIDASGKSLAEPKSIDLSVTNPDGSFRYSIVKSLDPKDFRINIPHYVLGG